MAETGMLGGTEPDKAEVVALADQFVPPPTAAEIDRRLQLGLFEEIRQKLQSDVDGFFPNGEKTRYSNVYVLLICWANEEPKLPVSLELDELCDVFSSYYGFQTEKWKIPPDDCHNQLNRKMLEFIALGGDSRQDCLLCRPRNADERATTSLGKVRILSPCCEDSTSVLPATYSA
jgi:hypothetical protein